MTKSYSLAQLNELARFLNQRLARLKSQSHNRGMEIRQDPKAWQAGYEAGQAGKTPPLPPGVDGLAFYSGVIEGQAVRGKNIRKESLPPR